LQSPSGHGAVFDDTDDAPPPSPFSAELETGLIFDNNVFQEKDSERGDRIWTSYLQLAYEKGAVFLSALAIIDRYHDNEVLNTEFYEIGIEAPLGAATSGSLFLNLSPTAPLDKTDLGPPFELDSRGLNFLLDHEMPLGRIGFSFAFTQLNYSATFEAKDSAITALGPTFFYFLSENWTVSGDAAFERGRAAGGFIGDRRDDISYRSTLLSIQTRYHFMAEFNLSIRYHFQKKHFTTKANDPLHTGRRDDHRLLRLTAEQRPTPNTTLRAGFEASRLNSTDPSVNFEARRWIFSAAYAF